jgi:hypothetical protein
MTSMRGGCEWLWSRRMLDPPAQQWQSNPELAQAQTCLIRCVPVIAAPAGSGVRTSTRTGSSAIPGIRLPVASNRMMIDSLPLSFRNPDPRPERREWPSALELEPRVNGVVLEINYELTPNHTHIPVSCYKGCASRTLNHK